MELIEANRLCADIFLKKDQNQVFPPTKKKVAQKEVRLMVSNRELRGKPGFYQSSVEVWHVESTDNSPLFSFQLEFLVAISKNWIKNGNILLIFDRDLGVMRENGSLHSRTEDLRQIERHELALREADPQNLEMLIMKINEIKSGKFLFPSKNRHQTSKLTNDNTPNCKAEASTLLTHSVPVKPNVSQRLSEISKTSLRDFTPTPRDLQEEQRKLKSLIAVNLNKKASIEKKPGQKSFDLLLNKVYFARILEMLDAKDTQTLLMLNHKSYRTICDFRADLDLSRYSEIPEKFVIGLLKRYNKIESLSLGKLLNFKPTFEKYKELSLKHLKSVNMGALTSFNDAFVALLIELAPNVSDITVPFFSLTTHSLLKINESFKHLERFCAVHESKSIGVSGFVNKKLATKALAQVLTDQPLLKEFHVFSCELNILDSAFKNLKNRQILSKLTTFRINHVLIQGKEDFKHLSKLSHIFTLRKLALEDLHLFDDVTSSVIPLPNLPTAESSKALEGLFSAIPEIYSVSLGDFAEDVHLGLVASKLRNLRSLAVRSAQVTDEGLAEVIRKCPHLQKLKIAGCDRVQGHVFEEVPEGMNLRELGASFDDYTFELIRKLFLSKKITRCIIVKYV